jgi:hypothetical protein
MARNVVELTEEDLDNPAIAFTKMTAVMMDMRQDLVESLARTVPDYRSELKNILTALKAIQDKPAMAIQVGVLEDMARQGAESGTEEAVTALRSSAADYAQAQRRETTLVDEVRQLSWKYHLVFAGLVLFAGVTIGLLVGRAIDNREEPPPPSITLDAEKVVARLVEQFPSVCPKTPVPHSGKR